MSVPTADTAGPDIHPVIMQTVALTLRPTLGDPVALTTRVLDLEPHPDGRTAIVVASPEGLDPHEHHFDATVSWTYPLGRMECTVSTRPGTRNYGRVWLLRPSAPPSRLQQRAYFRARVAVAVAISWTAEDQDGNEETVEVLGTAIDLSEGGLLASAGLPLPPVGLAVTATVRVDGDNLAQRARIVRHVRFAGGGCGLAVSFDDPSAHGDRIRRLVFETERRRRRPR